MKRRILSCLLCMILVLGISLPVSATSHLPRIVDNADLLTPEEEQLLEEDAIQFGIDYSLDAVILTVDNLGGKSISAYADDYYDYNGYGVGTDYSGLILVVSMTERELYISTCGDAINRLNDSELDDIINNISYDLSDGNYYDAFQLFFGFTTLYLDDDSNGASDLDVMMPEVNWLISLLVGVLAGVIVIMIMISTMNTKRRQHSAGDYLKQGSFDLKNRQDIFLYSSISKVKREQNNSSGGGTSVHRGSSGRSHGGRGGRF